MKLDAASVSNVFETLAHVAARARRATDAAVSSPAASTAPLDAEQVAREATTLIGEAPIRITPQRVLELAAGRPASSSDLRALGAWRTALDVREDPSRLADIATRLAASEPGSWTPEQLGSVAAVLHADATTNALGLPRSIPGARSLDRLVSSGTAPDAETLRRYMDAWRSRLGASAAPEAPSEAAELVRDGGIDSWLPERWRQLQSALDADAAPGRAHLKQLDGMEPFSLVAGNAAQAGPDAAARRYVAAWQVHADATLAPPEARRAAALDLLARQPDELEPSQWRRLAALIDVDVDHAIRSSSGGASDLPDLAELASRHADGIAVAAETRRAFAAWRTIVDGTAADPRRMAHEFRDLVGRIANEPTRDDLLRISGMLDVDSAGTTLLGPRQLAGAEDFGTVVRELARRPADASTPLQRYTDAWALHFDQAAASPSMVRRAVRELVEHEPHELSAEQWRRLASLVDLDADGAALRMPSSFDALEPLPALAARASRGMPVPEHQLGRTFAAWRVGLDDDATSTELMRRVRGMLDQQQPLAPRQWRELGAILDLGTERTGVRLPAIADADPVFRRDVRELAHSTRLPMPATERVLDAWRLQLQLGAGGADGVRAHLLDLLSPPGGMMDVERWRGVRAVFDFAGDGIDGVALDQRHASELTQLAAEGSTGGWTSLWSIEDPLIDRWRHALDPKIISERRRAVREALDGGQLPDGLTTAELRDLDPRWAQRTAFEQLTLEAGVGNLVDSELVRRLTAVEHAPANMPDQLADLWRSTRRLADVNRQRMGGTTPRGEVRGYSTHPDYAEVGRIRTNLELIRRLTPPANPVAPPPAASRAGELLDW